MLILTLIKYNNMITPFEFKQFIQSYLRNSDSITINTFDDYLNNYSFGELFHNTNFNKVKGDIFEFIAKYYYMKDNLEVYLFNEIPIHLKDTLNLLQLIKA